MRKGEVRVNGKRAKPDTRLRQATSCAFRRCVSGPSRAAARAPAALVYEPYSTPSCTRTRELLVIDKPAGVAVHGGSGVSFGVIEALRAARPEEDARAGPPARPRNQRVPARVAQARGLRALHALLREGQVEKRISRW